MSKTQPHLKYFTFTVVTPFYWVYSMVTAILCKELALKGLIEYKFQYSPISYNIMTADRRSGDNVDYLISLASVRGGIYLAEREDLVLKTDVLEEAKGAA